MPIRAFSAVLLLAALGTPALARDLPPPSPYDLPVPLPGLQTGPEEEQPIRPWRHWGDSRLDGEFFADVQRDGFLASAPPVMSRAEFRLCQVRPDRCRR